MGYSGVGDRKKGLPDVTHEIHGTEGVQARNSWLVGGFKHFWNCPQYMGCHPSH